MSGFPKKRDGTIPKNGGGYRKVDQVKYNDRWLPAISSDPLVASEARPFRAKEATKLEERKLYDFKFKIVRDDGVIIDHTLIPPYYGIRIYQNCAGNPQLVGDAHGYDPEEDPEDAEYWTYEDGNEKGRRWTWFYNRGSHPYETKFNYDTRTQIWTVPFYYSPNIFIRRHKLFWVTFYCIDSVLCMLSPPEIRTELPEYIYKEKDFYQDKDRVIPKFHPVRVPYYKATPHGETRTPCPDFPDDDRYGYCGDIATSYYGRCQCGGVAYKTITVQSSIPYTVSFGAGGTPIGSLYGWNFPIPSTTRTVAQTYAIAWTHWYQTEWFYTEDGFLHNRPFPIPEHVRASTSNGDLSDNIETNPMHTVQKVSPVPYEVSTTEHEIKIEYTGPDPYEIRIECSDGVAVFPLDFRIFRALYFISALPDID